MLALGACGGVDDAGERGAPREEGTRLVASNVLREDYVGSEACAPCHREHVSRAEGSPMRRMTRAIDETVIAASFDGTTMRYRDDVVTMQTVDGRRYVRLERPGAAPELWRVTKVIGGRTREDFAGVWVRSTEAGAATARFEDVLPASFILGTREWRYKGYSVMTPERPHVTAGPVWSQTCILCHNTAPHVVSLYDDLVGDGAPKYQGSLSSNLLPDDRRWQYRVDDERALRRSLRAELARLGGELDMSSIALQTALVHATDLTWRRFDEGDLVELGIGCEACHNGSREHADDPRALPTFELRGAITFGPPRGAGTPAAHLNRTCARCHSVLFSDYPHTWEGGDRDRSPGGSHINSGEGRDFLLGGCADAMTCTQCHDAHAHDDPRELARIASPAGNAICTSCHAELAGDDAFNAHAHHTPDGAAGACVSCHMPRKNMGLGYELTRYHRIGSPNDPARVQGDRPLECALCHADRTAGDLVDTMERWWGGEHDRARLTELYGSLDANVIDATLAHGEPHEVAVALAVAAEAGDRDRLPAAAAALENEIPLVRYWAREAMWRLAGIRAELDMGLPGPDLAAAGRRWLGECTLP